MSVQTLEAGDALQRCMFPYLSLRHILVLKDACKAWRQLVVNTPVCQLSEEARETLLPSGLTSERSLLELVRQQAGLVARLRGNQGPLPCIQHLSLIDPFRKHANVQQSRFPMEIQRLVWSPCIGLEDASRWIILEPLSIKRHASFVADTESSQQVCFQTAQSESVPAAAVSRKQPQCCATWLEYDDCILFHPSNELCTEPCSPTVICVANARTKNVCRLQVTGAQQEGNSQFCTVSSGTSSEKNILCWVINSVTDRLINDQISVYDMSRCLPLYQLSLPSILSPHLPEGSWQLRHLFPARTENP